MVIERMAVIGAGQMGAGIAQVAAQAGVEVVLADATFELARAGLERVAVVLAKLVEKGKFSAGDRTALLGRIKPAERLEDCARAQLLVEAIVENEAAKKELFRRVDALLAPEAIFAS
ncbi:MAG TPA: 3-hydroxyacyl-CoA dehydrogenase NAD-binding domain-containing protein, partial [Anaeromyxobacteraceae bacterium]|nr:3-hydroxyacyl-CoA dehydrogenase NAD-binding domain-containing protein [Anaeromyxobacteraceae bacterium]